MINKIKDWFNCNFICRIIFSKGHIPIDRLWEDEISIHIKCCKRCNRPLGLGNFKTYDCLPPLLPNETEEENRTKWHNFLDKKYDEMRKKFNYINSNKNYKL